MTSDADTVTWPLNGSRTYEREAIIMKSCSSKEKVS